jgi:siroheme synthase (precorrin-2 oxidase/ferrochelatase)
LRVLVVGGGEEAYKKARRFLAAGSRVTVLAREFHPGFRQLKADGLRLLPGDASDLGRLAELIEEADLVVSALGDAYELDTEIIRLARRFRRLYILAGDAGRTQCGMGIEGRSGGIRFALYTDGRSSLVAMEARDRVARFLDGARDLHLMLKVLGAVKRWLRSLRVSSDTRIALHRRIFHDQEFRRLASSGDLAGMWERARQLVKGQLGLELPVEG